MRHSQNLWQILSRSTACGLATWLAGIAAISSHSGGLSRAAEPLGTDSQIDQGREIFQREWTHESAAPIQQGNLPDPQFAAMQSVSSGDGLGPMFNAVSCESCHQNGGASGVDRNVTLLTLDPRNRFIGQLGGRGFAGSLDGDQRKQLAEQVESKLKHLFPPVIAANGQLAMDVVVHEQSARPGYNSIRQRMEKYVPGGLDAAWFSRHSRTSAAIGNQPVVAGRYDGIDFYLSQRNSPALHGLSLIDQISQAKLEGVMRAQFRRTDGRISGRLGAGKFGWRGQTQSLASFVQGACAGELGLQVPGTNQPEDVADPTYQSHGLDLTSNQLLSLVRYVESLPPPPVPHRSPEATAGARLFSQIGCSDCHIQNMMPASGVYSDLLLHDMGAWLQAPSPSSVGVFGRFGASRASAPTMRLPTFSPSPITLVSNPKQARRTFAATSVSGYYGGGGSPSPYPFESLGTPKFPRGSLPDSVTKGGTLYWDVLQREWRTPPLWGVADTAPYLHDGRAETLDAAIRWHGGESAQSATQYRSLSKADQALVLTFLRSLRGPGNAVRPAVPDMLSMLEANPDLLSGIDAMASR
ncbi:MAG: di-heme oxidoredictase family protein [Rubripirellula sp.]